MGCFKTFSITVILLSSLVFNDSQANSTPFLSVTLSDEDAWILLHSIADSRESTDDIAFDNTITSALSAFNVDAEMDLAYAFHGMSHVSVPRPDLVQRVLQPHEQLPKVKALVAFLYHRSVDNALAFIQKSDTPQSLALGYMCLAEAEYAKGDTAKAIMAATLSLAYNFSETREKQAIFYLTESWDSNISLKGSKEEVADNLVTVMKETIRPKTFRNFFAMVSVLGLLSEFPYTQESLTESSREPIHIVVGFDDNYTYHGGVTFLSAMISADPATRYVFHVPEDPESLFPITELHKEKLQRMVRFFPRDKYEVIFEEYDVGMLPEQLRAGYWGIWPRAVFFKLYIPEIYVEHDKIMWLDSDLIVRADVTSFYNQDLKGKWLAGVRDISALAHLPRLGFNEEDAYVNAGVMVFDNVNLRENMDLLSKALASVDDPDTFFVYPEQDIFAVAFRGHIKEVGRMMGLPKVHYFKHGHWNFFYHKTHPTERWDRIHKHFAYIFHLNGRHKPWRYSKGRMYWSFRPWGSDGMQNLYWILRDMGPWPTRMKKDWSHTQRLAKTAF